MPPDERLSIRVILGGLVLCFFVWLRDKLSRRRA